ncbi:MAG: YfhJ family protein [Bacillus sp. (in: firmicutes)]
MNVYQEELTKLLLEKNHDLSYDQARTWVELLWEDFETTYAKAGWEYKGSEMTERIVKQWIENYGDKLHEFIATNPKYKHFLNQGKGQTH